MRTEQEIKEYLRIYGWTLKGNLYYHSNHNGGHPLQVAYRAQKFG